MEPLGSYRLSYISILRIVFALIKSMLGTRVLHWRFINARCIVLIVLRVYRVDHR